MNPVAKLTSLPLESFKRGQAYASADVRVANRIGLEKLGATYTEVPPGKSSCPFHVHHVDEEMFVILEGKGRYRFGSKVYEVEAGDVLGAPCGRAEFAHKLTNTGTRSLKYLAISTMAQTDVCEYPDSGKFAVGTRSDDPEEFGFIGRADESLDYWDGERDSAL
ncbi:MAG: cupin domain-containing protein [Gammaproteobacteria bacterium]|nr:cupin domain-containing protein [Gammaproteobacteria bacterium]